MHGRGPIEDMNILDYIGVTECVFYVVLIILLIVAIVKERKS